MELAVFPECVHNVSADAAALRPRTEPFRCVEKEEAMGASDATPSGTVRNVLLMRSHSLCGSELRMAQSALKTGSQWIWDPTFSVKVCVCVLSKQPLTYVMRATLREWNVQSTVTTRRDYFLANRKTHLQGVVSSRRG